MPDQQHKTETDTDGLKVFQFRLPPGPECGPGCSISTYGYDLASAQGGVERA